MSAMRVTVGIPTYNRSGMLKGAIESVLAQTYTDFRLIVSDNASEDDTPEVVRSFADDRIEYVRAEVNVGPAGNFRRLLELAETEFLLILPDDDVLYPDHLRVAVEVMDRHPDVGLVHTAFDLIDDRSAVTGTMHPVESRSAVTIERRDLAHERLMVSDFPICFSSVLYRTQAIVDASGIRAEEEPFGDLQLWMRIATRWDFGYVDRQLTGFRIHEATTTTNISAEEGVATDDRELALMYGRIRFKRRIDFLADAAIDPRSVSRLRALATLHDLVERAYWGLPSREVAAAQVRIARAYPRVVLRPAFWRLVVAQLGGRRLRAALRGVSARPAG
jgi:glycosyltransferase involved in cell wall biosynthesis